MYYILCKMNSKKEVFFVLFSFLMDRRDQLGDCSRVQVGDDNDLD